MVSSSGRWCMTSIHSALYSHLYSPLLFWHSYPPPQCPFPMYAFYANSTDGNDAVRVHFIGVLMISLFCFFSPHFGSLCVVMRRTGSVRVLRSTPVSCASSPPASETRVHAAPPVFPRHSSKRRVFAPTEGRVSSAMKVCVDADLHRYQLRRWSQRGQRVFLLIFVPFWGLFSSITSVFEVRPIGGILKVFPAVLFNWCKPLKYHSN